VLHAARWKYRTKKSPKSRHLGTIAQIWRAILSQLRHLSTIGKKDLLSSNISTTYAHNMVNFGPLAAEIGPVAWGAPLQISTGFASWKRYCTALVVGVNQTLRR